MSNDVFRAVVDWLAAPDTQFLLDFVRPDFLMLRVIARSLVLWDEIHPSDEWIDSNIPEIVNTYAFNKAKYRDDPDCDIDFETMRWVGIISVFTNILHRQLIK